MYTPVIEHVTVDQGSGCIRFKDPKKGGRRRNLNATASLALLLAWTRTKGSNHTLGMIFGDVISCTNFWLKVGRRVLLRSLKKCDKAQVKMPVGDVVGSYVDAIAAKYPRFGVLNVAFAIDGVKLPIEKSSSEAIQKAFYNGWTSGHYISNVFMFAPDGCIRAMVINAPGSMHDSTVMEIGEMYDLLEVIHKEHGVAFCVDSAFCARFRPWLVKSSQNPPDNASALDILLHADATSVRQIAEWGVGTFQIAFPRMTERFSFEQRGEHRYMVNILERLFNLCANLVGINQIRTTYMPQFVRPAHEEYVNRS